VQTVRRHPEWYFRSGRFDSSEAISLLVEEATRAGATSVEVRRQVDWTSVSADVDWLLNDVAAFFAPVSYPEGGRNSARVEVALTAFCDAVVTATAAGVFEVSSAPEGSAVDRELLVVSGSHGRTVAFLPPREARILGGPTARNPAIGEVS
jgi:hypothetical protein